MSENFNSYAPNRPRPCIIFCSKSAEIYEESNGVNNFDLWEQQHNLKCQKPQQYSEKDRNSEQKSENFNSSAPNRPSCMIFRSKSAEKYEESDGGNDFNFW